MNSLLQTHGGYPFKGLYGRVLFFVRGVYCLFELVFNGIDVVVHRFFEFADADDSKDVAETDENKAKTEQPGEGDAGSVQMIETENAKNSTGDTEDHENPPVLETEFLVVKALDKLHDAFEHNPDGKNNGQRQRHRHGVAEEK